MSSYSYDTTTTFPTGYDSTKLYKDIRGQIAKPATYGTVGDTLYITFSFTLSVGQEATLDYIITNHTPTPDAQGIYQTLVELDISDIANTTYTSIATFEYNGRNVDELTNIKFVGHISAGSYSVRIYDITHSTIIAEITGQTNTADSSIDLGTISNVPYSASLVTVQVKVNSGANTLSPKSLALYYN